MAVGRKFSDRTADPMIHLVIEPASTGRYRPLLDGTVRELLHENAEKLELV
jgi:hypothetical protein